MTEQSCTTTRAQEVAALRHLLHLQQAVWSLYGCLASHAAGPRAQRMAVACGGDHRQHIIALRTRLALLGANVSAWPAPRRLRLVGLQLLGHLGLTGALRDALLRAEAELRDACRSLDTSELSACSVEIVERILADERDHAVTLRAITEASTPQASALAAELPGDFKVASKHWAFARL